MSDADKKPDEPQIPESTDAYMVIPTPVVQGLLNYLDTRPHREVRALIDAVLQCNPKPKPKAVPKE